MLLTGLPPVVRVNVRGSNAGAWLEASVRYALAEARSPRPGGAGVLAKLSEVLFIEVLRLYMKRTARRPAPAGLAGVGDRIVGAALNALHKSPAHAWTLEEPRTPPPARRARCWPSGSSSCRQLADAVPDAVADAARIEPAVPQATHRSRASRRTSAIRPTPRSAARSGGGIRLAAGGLAAEPGGARAGRLRRSSSTPPWQFKRSPRPYAGRGFEKSAQRSPAGAR